MTIIVYRDGVMAADSVGWTANNSVKVPAPGKIRRLSDGGLIGAAGETSDIIQFHEWMAADRPRDTRPEFGKDDGFCALWVKPDGALSACTWKLVFFPIATSFFAIGGPAEFVMGALYSGASAEDAARLAIEFTDSAGGPVQIERLAGIIPVASYGQVDKWLRRFDLGTGSN